MIRLDLPLAKPPLSANHRLHYQAKARKVKTLRTMSWALARHHKVPPMWGATVTLHYRPANRRSLTDAANMMPTLKPLTDGLTAAGVLVNGDASKYVDEVCRLHDPDPGEPAAVWLTIEPRTEPT